MRIHDMLRRAAILVAVLLPLGCSAAAPRPATLPAASVQAVLKSIGLEQAWDIQSYPQPDAPERWVIEAFGPRRDEGVGACSAEKVILQVTRQASTGELHVDAHDSDRDIALVPCARATADYFKDMFGPGDVAQIATIVARLPQVAECAQGCADWASVHFSDPGLAQYLGQVGPKSLSHVHARPGRLLLGFLVDGLMERYLTFEIKDAGKGARSVVVSAEEIR